MNESRERIRRERERARTAGSPRAALRRVLLLAEGRQFREAAALLARLARAALAPVAADLPLDLLADALPHSATLIETLLNRLVELDVRPQPPLPVEALAWRVAAQLGAGGAGEAARLAGAARALARFAPELPAAVDARRRQLDQAVHGLGTHGLTAGSAEGGAGGELVSLHAALRDELQAHVDAYKQALHKIQELSAVTAVSAPAASSHQRLLALPAGDVERRLIDNASLLAAVQRAPPRLAALTAALAARVASDKQVLACAGLVRRADPARPPRAPQQPDSRPVAGVLMSYSRGCAALLALMTEGAPPAPPAPLAAAADAAPPRAPRSPPDSASDGYHSDSDHAQPLPDRSAEVAGAVAVYGAAWARAAGRWLPALAALPALARAPSLPHKIVFSVVVLSFRAAISLRDKRLDEVKTLLGVAEGAETAREAGADDGADEAASVARLEAAARRALRAGAHRYPLADAERTVVAQVAGTLREYAGLAEAPALRALAASACRAAWRLALHDPPLRLDTDFTATRFDPERHVRWCAEGAEAGARGEAVRSFVWPALMDGPRCLFRAVVLT